MIRFLKKKFEKFQVQAFRKFIIKFYEIYMNINRFKLKIVNMKNSNNIKQYLNKNGGKINFHNNQ